MNDLRQRKGFIPFQFGDRKVGNSPRGLGDVVAAFAKPVARAIDAIAGTNLKKCGGCAKRQQKLNEKFPL